MAACQPFFFFFFFLSNARITENAESLGGEILTEIRLTGKKLLWLRQIITVTYFF